MAVYSDFDDFIKKYFSYFLGGAQSKKKPSHEIDNNMRKKHALLVGIFLSRFIAKSGRNVITIFSSIDK